MRGVEDHHSSNIVAILEENDSLCSCWGEGSNWRETVAKIGQWSIVSLGLEKGIPKKIVVFIENISAFTIDSYGFDLSIVEIITKTSILLNYE